MSSNCTFTLKTDQFALTLEGDERFVRDAYASLREEILRRVRPSGVTSTTSEVPPIEESELEDDGRPTQQMLAPSEATERPTERDQRRRPPSSEGRPTIEGSPRSPAPATSEESDFVWVLECDTLYNKVRAVDREHVARTAVGRQVDPYRLHRIYVEAHDGARLRGLLPAGKTLWSELTALGRQRLRQS